MSMTINMISKDVYGTDLIFSNPGEYGLDLWPYIKLN